MFEYQILKLLILSKDMGWSERARQGFALAAVVADDPGGRLAEQGLAPRIAQDVTHVAKALAVMDKKTRREEISRISKLLSPPLSFDVKLPPRARRLLASTVSREVAQQWLADAPLPRPGYQPEPGLRAVIRWLAEEGSRKT
jgi:hypothetical protein